MLQCRGRTPQRGGRALGPQTPSSVAPALCSSRRPTVWGHCGCVRIRPPGSPSPAPVLGIRGLPGANWAPGRVGGLGAGSLGCPQRTAVEGGRPHSQPRAGPCFVTCGRHILVGNGCLVLGGGQHLLPFLDWRAACGRVSGSSGAAVGLPEPQDPNMERSRPRCPAPLGLPLTPLPVSWPLRWSPRPV